MTDDERDRYDELVAAVAYLRGESDRLRTQIAELERRTTAPAVLRAANARLRGRNAELRRKIRAKRRHLPPDVFPFGTTRVGRSAMGIRATSAGFSRTSPASRPGSGTCCPRRFSGIATRALCRGKQTTSRLTATARIYSLSYS